MGHGFAHWSLHHPLQHRTAAQHMRSCVGRKKNLSHNRGLSHNRRRTSRIIEQRPLA
jgi:hypothetical protein